MDKLILNVAFPIPLMIIHNLVGKSDFIVNCSLVLVEI